MAGVKANLPFREGSANKAASVGKLLLATRTANRRLKEIRRTTPIH